MSIQTIIVDDEKQSRIALCEELNAFEHDIEIIGEADNVKSAVKLIDEKKPDLLFLDINLGDGSGFNVLEQITWKDLKVVFVTAYDQYAIKAFKFNAIDYILKPINSIELKQAIEKATAQKNTLLSSSNFKELIHNFRNTIQKKIAIPTSEGISFIPVDEIIRCQSDSNYTFIYLLKGERILTAKTLREFEELLSEWGFERIHNSHIVNINEMSKYVNKDGGYVVMRDGSNVPVAQRKKTHLLSILGNS